MIDPAAPETQATQEETTAPARQAAHLPPSPSVRLVPAAAPGPERVWDIPLPTAGRWRVTGPAGAGVTSFLVDTVIARIRAGADPAGIVVVTASKESGALLRRELSERLDNYAAPSTLVRSVHSLAFALVRRYLAAVAATALGGATDLGAEQLRLITGAEQDAVIRELLDGHVEDGGAYWPAEMRDAVGMLGFARQLRDFLLRAGERGLGPEELQDLGRAWKQPMWIAAGEFQREYDRVMALAGRRNMSAAELVSFAARTPDIARGNEWHTVIVDDAQLLDPNSARLVAALALEAELAVIGGDVDQGVFAFRGANADFFAELPEKIPGLTDIALPESRRLPSPACVDVVASAGVLREALADTVRRRHLTEGVPWSEIAVIVRGHGDIGQARRTLLAAGVPVHINPTDVVLGEQRLVAAVLAAVRALYEPITVGEVENFVTGPVGGADPVTYRRLIRGLRRFDPGTRGVETLRALLEGPLPDFGDKLTGREQAILERARAILAAGREAHAAGGSIEDVLWAVWSSTGLAERLQAAALRGGATGSQADRDLDAMMALFDAAGDFAERYPEADIATFVAHITEQELPTGVRDRRAARPEAVEILSAHGAVGREWDTVVVIGAQEGSWPSLGETGSIFGQEDLIDLLDDGIPPGSHVSHVADRLAEERRLFHVATTRHRSRLTILSVDAPDGDVVYEPSRFLDEFQGPGLDLPATLARRAAADSLRRTALAREMGLRVPDDVNAAVGIAPDVERGEKIIADREDVALPPEPEALQVSVLSTPAFVAHLRRVLIGRNADGTPRDFGEAARQQAARQLARLAAAGVPGADPAQWWGVDADGIGKLEADSQETVTDLSANAGADEDTVADTDADTDASTEAARGPVALSPSRVEALLKCPLNALLSNMEVEEGSPLALVRGNMAHAFMEALGRGVDVETAARMTRDAFVGVLDVPAWKRDLELQKFDELLARTQRWLEETRDSLPLVGVEVPVRVQVDENVVIHGYIDRLVRDGDDYTVVDLKTGGSAPTVAKTQEHAQLGAYQWALAHATVEETAAGPRVVTARDDADHAANSAGVAGVSVGGGILVYPGVDSAKVTTREQAAWTPEQLEDFAARVLPIARYVHADRVPAKVNDGCDRCAVRSLCPVQPEGRMVTDERA